MFLSVNEKYYSFDTINTDKNLIPKAQDYLLLVLTIFLKRLIQYLQMSDNQSFESCEDFEELDSIPIQEQQSPKVQTQVPLPQIDKSLEAADKFQNSIIKQNKDIRLDHYQIKPSNIDIYSSFNKECDKEQPENNFIDYQQGVGISIHMQSEEFKTHYLPNIRHDDYGHHLNDNKYEKKNNNDDFAFDQSIHSFKKQRMKPSSSMKQEIHKQHVQKTRSDREQSEKKETSDSSLGINVPIASKLKTNVSERHSFSKSGSSIDSAGKLLQTKKRISHYQIRPDCKSVRFESKDKKEYVKQVSEPYLEYIQKYFFYNFNLLLPVHVPEILSSSSGVRAFIQIYFDFIVYNYPEHLLEFLQKSNFKEIHQNKKEQITLQSGIQSKLLEYKNKFVQKIYSGYDSVGEIVKKFKGETQTKIRVLENLFSKQAIMAEKHFKARARLQNLTHSAIHPSAYEKQQAKVKSEQQYILMCLRWLVGFQLAIESIKQKQQKADPVEKEKFEKIINQFQSIKEREQRQKIKMLQQKIRSMASFK